MTLIVHEAADLNVVGVEIFVASNESSLKINFLMHVMYYAMK